MKMKVFQITSTLLITVTVVSFPFPIIEAAKNSVFSAVSALTIPRFQEVADGLYRGGQPDKADFAALQLAGIHMIINFRSADESRDEENMVKALRMKYVNIPLSGWHRIPNEAIRDFFQFVSEPSNLPVFVHCRRGADRTGAMVGFYRIAFQGWTAEKAYREARDIGMRWWYPHLRDQLFEFERHAQEFKASASVAAN